MMRKKGLIDEAGNPIPQARQGKKEQWVSSIIQDTFLVLLLWEDCGKVKGAFIINVEYVEYNDLIL